MRKDGGAIPCQGVQALEGLLGEIGGFISHVLNSRKEDYQIIILVRNYVRCYDIVILVQKIFDLSVVIMITFYLIICVQISKSNYLNLQ